MGLTLEECKTRLLAKLEESGPTGLNKTGLGIRGSSKTSKLYTQALSELEGGRLIGNLGTRTGSRYVLRQHFRPLELAYDQVDAKAARNGPTLFTKSELEVGLKGPMKSKVDEAIQVLVQDGKLIRLRRGNAIYYLYAASLPGRITTTPPRERVLAAYRAAVKETELSNVAIDELRRRLGNIPLDELHAFLKEACHAGRAIPSRGDWSLATKAARAAALYIDGQAYLLIQLQA